MLFVIEAVYHTATG